MQIFLNVLTGKKQTQCSQRLYTGCKENSVGLEPNTFSEKMGIKKTSSAISKEQTPEENSGLEPQGFRNVSAHHRAKTSQPFLSLHYYILINQAEVKRKPSGRKSWEYKNPNCTLLTTTKKTCPGLKLQDANQYQTYAYRKGVCIFPLPTALTMETLPVLSCLRI